jgi:hypothetical protein
MMPFGVCRIPTLNNLKSERVVTDFRRFSVQTILLDRYLEVRPYPEQNGSTKRAGTAGKLVSEMICPRSISGLSVSSRLLLHPLSCPKNRYMLWRQRSSGRTLKRHTAQALKVKLVRDIYALGRIQYWLRD